MTVRISARHRRNLSRWLAVMALLGLYAIGSTQTGYLHQLFHPDEITAVHSAGQEQDPCHQSLFHGIGKGCGHEFHLAKVSSCGLFHVVGHNDVQLCFTHVMLGVIPEEAPSIKSGQGHSRPALRTVFLRGPPRASLLASLA